MNLFPRLKARNWHLWVSIVLVLPMLLVALTAVLIAHRKALGADQISVAAAWLPGYRESPGAVVHPDVRSSLVDRAGKLWLGTQEGLYLLDGAELKAVDALAGVPVRDLLETGAGLFAATRTGIWQYTASGQWQRVLKGEAWNLTLRPDQSLLALLRDKPPQTSRDGRRWTPDAQGSAGFEALARRPAGERSISLGKLILDLHTGQALFGKSLEWVWIDILGLSLASLAITGLQMWRKAQRRKAALQGG